MIGEELKERNDKLSLLALIEHAVRAYMSIYWKVNPYTPVSHFKREGSALIFYMKDDSKYVLSIDPKRVIDCGIVDQTCYPERYEERKGMEG